MFNLGAKLVKKNEMCKNICKKFAYIKKNL